MRHTVIFFSCLSIFVACSTQSNDAVDIQPNIIYILADDLGYGEIGVQGQSIIKTPNIDALAASGMRFTQHYAGSPVCAPSRCVLLTGKHTGHAPIRGNDEWRARGEVWDYYAMLNDPTLEGQRPLADSIVTLGEVLQKAGYTTGIFGKWGLGAPETEGIPNNQGFDEFYGYNCQRQAHSLYPTHLWHNQNRVFLNNDTIPYHTPLDSLADPTNPENYRPFIQLDYGPEMIHKKAIEFIEHNKEKPFFLYYASPLPHLPIQVPHANVETYFSSIAEEKPYTGNNGYFPNQYPRAAYAAMISYLDQQVGALIETLKALGLYENTIIMFSSDNGPTYTGGVDYTYFNSSAPFTNGYGRTKGFVYEGGIRVPFIVSWPGNIHAGTRSEHVSCFMMYYPPFAISFKSTPRME